MATVYKLEVTSHYISYSIDELKKIIEDAIKKDQREKGNIIQINLVEDITILK